MANAPTPAPHTPIVIVKAGGAAMFSADCAKALAKAGYSPDDFGSYDHVSERIQQAKQDRQNYVAQQRRNGQPVDPHGPDPHTAMLARSQSGHLSQDAAYREPGGRGNACNNHTGPPPAPDARGYHSNMAPCMPMPTHSERGRGTIGSPHWAVGRNESTLPQNQTLSPGQLAQNSRENIEIATREGGGPQRQQSAIDSANWNTQRRATAQKRADDLAALQQASAGQLSADGPGTGQESDSGQAQGEAGQSTTATQCIEAYREAAMAQMRADVVDKYGENYAQTRADAENQVSAAQQRVDQTSQRRQQAADQYQAARGNVESAKQDVQQARASGDQNRIAAAEQRLSDARSDRDRAFWDSRRAQNDHRNASRGLQDAQNELESVDCLNRQARSLCGVDSSTTGPFTPPSPTPSMPPFTGQVG